MRAGVKARALLLGVAFAGPFALLACTSSNGGHLPAARAAGPKIVVTVEGGCPRTLGPAKGVRNDSEGLAQHLLPPSTRPANGLVCEYTGSTTGRQRVATKLARSVSLNAHDATRLASAISHVSVKAEHGGSSCPNQQFGTIAVLAFDYVDRSVDLWYDWSGCQTLDNGYVSASQGGNPSFYSGFQPVFDSLAPLPRQ